jgi:hypothetical protein
MNVIPWYWALETFRIVHKRENLYEVANHLLKLANASDKDTVATDGRHQLFSTAPQLSLRLQRFEVAFHVPFNKI